MSKSFSFLAVGCLAPFLDVGAVVLKEGRDTRDGKSYGKWWEWQKRIALTTGSSKSVQLSAQKGTQQAKTWSRLGENTWMALVDGCDHHRGKHAYDGTTISKSLGQDGSFFRHQAEVFNWFDDPSFWAKYDRWTAHRMGEANAVFRGDASGKPSYSAFWPRCRGAGQGLKALENNPWFNIPFYSWMDCKRDTNHGSSKEKGRTIKDKKNTVNWLFARYYNATDSHQCNPLAMDGSCVRMALPDLAELWVGLAELHPFLDANSRTRQLVLNTELVRLGGHAVIMGDQGWRLYWSNSRLEAEWLIINGWCNWEYVATTGRSPYESRMHNIVSYHNIDKVFLDGACGKPSPEPYPKRSHGGTAKTPAMLMLSAESASVTTESNASVEETTGRSSCSYEPAIDYFGAP